MASQKELPAFFNNDFFKAAVEQGFKISNIKVEDVKIDRIAGGGDNYTSEILKVLVLYKKPSSQTTEKVALVVKLLHTGEDFTFSKELQLFRKEMTMYQKTFPAIENILNNKETLAPKFFYSSSDPDEVAVLQDLTVLGYKVANRIKGLDEDHTRLVLRKIAMMHAGSMILAKNDPDSMNPFDHGMLNKISLKSKVFRNVFIGNLEHIVTVLEKWPDYEEIAKKIKYIAENFDSICSKFMEPKETAIKVLNHGDLWVNNLMFKYENDKPTDVLFVDLQMIFYSSLGIDLHYFLNTSVQLDVLKTKRYELLKYYYHTLKSTLKEGQYSPVPTWDQVKNEVRDTELYGFFAFEGVLPLISMDAEASKDNSFETLADPVKGKEKMDIMFSSEKMIKFMEYALNRFDELSVFDL